jgi:hypothetical protein
MPIGIDKIIIKRIAIIDSTRYRTQACSNSQEISPGEGLMVNNGRKPMATTASALEIHIHAQSIL